MRRFEGKVAVVTGSNRGIGSLGKKKNGGRASQPGRDGTGGDARPPSSLTY